MDFVRQILQVIEKRSAESTNPGVDVEGRSKDEVYAHLVIMQDRGLVEGVKHTSTSAICARMTWEGHEFLEQSRDEGMEYGSKPKTKPSQRLARCRGSLSRLPWRQSSKQQLLAGEPLARATDIPPDF